MNFSPHVANTVVVTRSLDGHQEQSDWRTGNLQWVGIADRRAKIAILIPPALMALEKHA